MYLLAHFLHICIMYCSRFKKMDNININFIILLYYYITSVLNLKYRNTPNEMIKRKNDYTKPRVPTLSNSIST